MYRDWGPIVNRSLRSAFNLTRLPCPWVPDGGAGAAVKASGGTQLGLEGEAFFDAVQDRRCHICEALWGEARLVMLASPIPSYHPCSGLHNPRPSPGRLGWHSH